ncbi:glycosyltransferase family 2 protein [Ligilactobacillus salivarius]|uniref:glycosyltransferase family 2 protein n=1 Tax=Ligilactobacillus salivarius TaxID=1624 RepID=UPI00237D654F|nr:glycosyltransferase family 2 protein [Ligilactobacillus salivarius]MDE1507155.1 glycosyltransferase [Ligilactobacillus salivarius]MDE1521671.1 glycosyltransferase [Ligilactobacillus salivarius]
MEKNEKVKISVIVPIYNVEKYLKKCLDSIINQTFKEFEIILVDDGSTDNSEMICKEYRRKDSRIVYLKKNNGGLSDARNYGLDYANGEYVAFIDSDDYLGKNFLEFLYRAIRTSKSEVAVCGFVIEYEDEKNLQDVSLHEDNVTITGKDLLHRVMKYKDGYSYVVAWNKLYKRELFDNIKFAKGKVYEDEWINYPLFWNVDKVYLLDKKLYHYVQRTGSIKNSRMSLKKIESMNEMLKDRILFYKDKDIKLFILANIRYRNWLINTLCRNKSMLSNEIITEWQEEFRKSVKNTRKIDKKERTIYWKLVDILGYININLTANIRKGLADLQEKI